MKNCHFWIYHSFKVLHVGQRIKVQEKEISAGRKKQKINFVIPEGISFWDSSLFVYICSSHEDEVVL